MKEVLLRQIFDKTSFLFWVVFVGVRAYDLFLKSDAAINSFLIRYSIF